MTNIKFIIYNHYHVCWRETKWNLLDRHLPSILGVCLYNYFCTRGDDVSLKSGSICECITCIKGLPWPCNDPCSRFRYNPPVSPPDCLVTSTVSGCLRVPVVLPTGIAAKITREQTYKMPVRSLGQEDPLEEGVATHSSLLAWRIPWTGEPGDPWSLGSLRVKHDSSDWAHMQHIKTSWTGVQLVFPLSQGLRS